MFEAKTKTPKTHHHDDKSMFAKGLRTIQICMFKQGEYVERKEKSVR